jgi:hypothetical protein
VSVFHSVCVYLRHDKRGLEQVDTVVVYTHTHSLSFSLSLTHIYLSVTGMVGKGGLDEGDTHAYTHAGELDLLQIPFNPSSESTTPVSKGFSAYTPIQTATTPCAPAVSSQGSGGLAGGGGGSGGGGGRDLLRQLPVGLSGKRNQTLALKSTRLPILPPSGGGGGGGGESGVKSAQTREPHSVKMR